MQLVWANLAHRPLRAWLSVFLIGFEVALLLTLVGLSRGLLEDSARRVRGIGADIFVKPPGSSAISLGSAGMPQAMVDFLARQQHVSHATGTVVHPIGGLAAVTGVELASYNTMSGGFHYVQGGPFTGPFDLIIDTFYARQNHKRAGDSVNLLGRTWRVCGVVEAGKLARLIAPLDTLQELTGNAGRVSQVFLKVDNLDHEDQVIAALREKLPGYWVYSVKEMTSMFSVENVPGLNTFVGLVVGLSTLVGFLVVALTMYTAILERTRDIGILKALGATPHFILDLLLREALLLAAFGILAGIGLSLLWYLALKVYAPASLPQVLAMDWWLISAVVVLIGALLGTLLPGYRASGQDTVGALAYE